MSKEIVKGDLKDFKTPSTVYDFATEAKEIYRDSLHILGFEFDGTACFRKGTKEGPDALRDVSDGIESFSPYLDMDTSEGKPFYDLGNLPLGDSEDAKEMWQTATDYFFDVFNDINLKKDGIKLLTLGGEHSISYAPIATYLKQYPDLVLIHLDAHADLRDGYEGYHYSHASIIRRSLDHFQEGHELIQYGIRSGTKEEYEWMRENKTIKTSRAEFIESVEKIADDRPVYLTLDLDYFDPSFLPGTGTPEPGGEDFHSFIKLIKILRNKNFVGCDVVELSPSIDQSGNSDVFAAKVVRELILILNK
ncbi:agmatinase [Halobacteriovorax sp. GB3]|uniref:agmatinase n=1 Tax=Halobacteriovorax sp. GB3 TaxID=2719615 RepID=UPI002360F00E|nr:agmatinase [Halobacteriovorax sp. GB3]MDD0853217.1 agmatinase [Halobacteriovorax sp. GB3]